MHKNLPENGGWNQVLSISWSKNLSLTIDIQRGSSCSRFACFKPSILPILSPPNHPCPLVSSQGIPKAPFLCACVTPPMPPVHIPTINSSFMLQCWNIDLPFGSGYIHSQDIPRHMLILTRKVRFETAGFCEVVQSFFHFQTNPFFCCIFRSHYYILILWVWGRIVYPKNWIGVPKSAVP
jgi:hypothetical protein